MRTRTLLLVAALAVPGCIIVEDRPIPRYDPPPAQVVVDDDPYRVMWIEYYGCPESTIDDCYVAGWAEDDIAVGLFLCYHAHVSIGTVIDLRARRLSWWDVTLRLNLRPEILYVEVPSHVAVGPPYGRAYGYFRKSEPGYVFVDADFHNLVHLRLMTHYYKLDAATVIHRRERGADFKVIVRENHGKSIGHDAKGQPVKQAAPKAKGKPNEKENPGKGKGKGKDK